MANLRTKFHMPISQRFCTYQQETDKKGQFSYGCVFVTLHSTEVLPKNSIDEGWNFNSGNYLFTTDTK